MGCRRSNEHLWARLLRSLKAGILPIQHLLRLWSGSPDPLFKKGGQDANRHRAFACWRRASTEPCESISRRWRAVAEGTARCCGHVTAALDFADRRALAGAGMPPGNSGNARARSATAAIRTTTPLGDSAHSTGEQATSPQVRPEQLAGGPMSLLRDGLTARRARLRAVFFEAIGPPHRPRR